MLNPTPMRFFMSWTAAIIAAVSVVSPAASVALEPGSVFDARPVDRLPAGIVIAPPLPKEWSSLVMYARPRLATGDLDAIPEIAKSYASMFDLAILANVAPVERQGRTVYELEKLALGFCMNVNGKNTVVTSADYKRIGADLNIISKQVLSENEKSLNEVVLVASMPTIEIFDAKAVMLREGQHRNMVMRHLVWVNASDGKLGVIVWLLDYDGGNGYRVAEPNLQLLPPAYVEDRQVNVDGRQITLGIPTAEAFALVRTPTGTPIPVNDNLARLAATRTFTSSRVIDLVKELNVAMQLKQARR